MILFIIGSIELFCSAYVMMTAGNEVYNGKSINMTLIYVGFGLELTVWIVSRFVMVYTRYHEYMDLYPRNLLISTSVI